jgi:hypothetical protein
MVDLIVYFMRARFPNWEVDKPPEEVGVYVVECRAQDVKFEVLDLSFYDDVSVVMIVRNEGESDQMKHTKSHYPRL